MKQGAQESKLLYRHGSELLVFMEIPPVNEAAFDDLKC